MHTFLLIQINRLVGFRDSCGIEKYHDGFFPPKKTNTSHPLGKNCGNHIIFNICALFSVGICELYSSPPKRAAIYWIYELNLSIKKKNVLETHPILPRTLFWQVLPTPVVKLPSAQVAGCTTGICPEITPSLRESGNWKILEVIWSSKQKMNILYTDLKTRYVYIYIYMYIYI